MKQIHNRMLSVTEANDRLGVDMEPGFWEALVGMIAYPEVTYVVATQQIQYPDYVPFEELAREWIEGIESGIYDVRMCEICAGYFDLDRTAGIFGTPEELQEYICMPCAESMSARDYYERFIERSRTE